MEKDNDRLRRTQGEFQSACARFAELYDSAPVGYLTLDAHGRITEANLTACRLFGVSRKTLIAKRLEAFVHQGDKPTLRRHLERAEHGFTYDLSDVIRLKHNHSPCFVRMESTFINPDRDHPEPGWHIAMLDLTEHEHVKSLQREQEHWLATLLDTAMDAVITTNETGQILLFNKGAEKIFRCPASQAIGQSLEQFIPPRFRDAHPAHIRRFIESGDTVRSTTDLRPFYGLRADGEEFPMEASISQFKHGGKIVLTVILRDITERVRARQALQDTTNLLQSVLHSADEGIIALDSRGCVVLWNQGAEKLFGRSEEDMMGQPLTKIMPNRFHQAHRAGIARSAAAGGKTVQGDMFELTGLRRNGTEFPLELSLGYWEKAGQTFFTGIVRDISRRKAVEQAFHQEQAFTNAVLDTAGALVVVLDRKGRIVRFNKACERLTGYPFDEIQGQRLWDLLLLREEAAQVKRVFRNLREGRLPSNLENRWVTKQGEHRWIAWTNTVLLNDTGTVEFIIGTGIDITDRRNAEQALRASEQRFQAFMDHTPAIAFLKDPAGRYVFVNHAFEEAFGLTADSVIGKTSEQLFPPEVSSQFIRNDKEVRTSNRTIEVEEMTIDQHGKPRHWLVYKFLVGDGRKEQPHLGGIRIDITTLKTTQRLLQLREAELERHHQELQALGGRLISIQEDERRRISRELHDDMNQRLALLALQIHSAQRGLKETDPLWALLQQLYDQVALLSDDVRHLAYQLHPSILDDLGLEVALNSFVKDFAKWEGIQATFSSKDVPPDIPLETACCLYRVGQEALRNVARHAKASSVELSLTYSKAKDRLALCVHDTGQGFDLNRVKTEGAGLGLIGMQERIRLVKGELTIDTRPGQGTKVCAWVPLSRGQDA